VQPTIIRGYDGGIAVGQREAFVFSGSGPASYSNIGSSSGTGDVITLPFGVYLDAVMVCMTVSKLYILFPFASAVGTTRATWTFRWFVAATMAEVANTTNLSGESVQFGALGGNF
jgi:hypothetical protein